VARGSLVFFFAPSSFFGPLDSVELIAPAMTPCLFIHHRVLAGARDAAVGHRAGGHPLGAGHAERIAPRSAPSWPGTVVPRRCRRPRTASGCRRARARW
jgi:hypothetical protein